MKFSNALLKMSENIYDEICEVLRRFKIIDELFNFIVSCVSFSIYIIIAEIMVKSMDKSNCTSKANEKIYLIW